MMIDSSNITSNNLREFKYTEEEAFILIEAIIMYEKELISVRTKAINEDKIQLTKFIKAFDNLFYKVVRRENIFTFLEVDYMLNAVNWYITTGDTKDRATFVILMKFQWRLKKNHDSFSFEK